MIVPNMLIQSTVTGAKAKVIFVNRPANVVQIEYINPQPSKFTGTQTISFKEIKTNWVELGLDIIDDKTISLTSHINQKDSCKHQWQAYHGLRESFEFCIHCDTKKS